MNRRDLLKHLAKTGMLVPFAQQLMMGSSALAAPGNKIVFFYYPNGCVSSDMFNGSFQTQALSEQNVPFKVHNKYLNGVPGGAHEGANLVFRAGQGGTTADHLIGNRIGSRVLNLGLRSEEIQSRFNVSWKDGSPQTNLSNPTEAANFLGGLGGSVENGNTGTNILLETLLEDFEALKAAATSNSADIVGKLETHISAMEELKPQAERVVEQPSNPQSCSYRTYDDPYYRTGGGSEAGGQVFDAVAKAQLDNIASAISCGTTRVATMQIGYADENPGMLNFGYVDECWRYMQQAGVPQQQRYWTESTSHTASHKPDKQHKAQNAYMFGLMAYLYKQLEAAGEAQSTTILAFSDVGDGAQHGPDNGGIVEVGNSNLSGGDFKGILNSAANWMGAGSIL